MPDNPNMNIFRRINNLEKQVGRYNNENPENITPNNLMMLKKRRNELHKLKYSNKYKEYQNLLKKISNNSNRMKKQYETALNNSRKQQDSSNISNEINIYMNELEKKKNECIKSGSEKLTKRIKDEIEKVNKYQKKCKSLSGVSKMNANQRRLSEKCRKHPSNPNNQTLNNIPSEFEKYIIENKDIEYLEANIKKHFKQRCKTGTNTGFKKSSWKPSGKFIAGNSHTGVGSLRKLIIGSAEPLNNNTKRKYKTSTSTIGRPEQPRGVEYV